MPLSPGRIKLEGQTPYDWEREAIAFIKKALPDGEPYYLWALTDLPEASGRIHQIDAIVLGYHALYVIEIKSWPGKLDGSFQHWKVTFPEGNSHVYENPIISTNHKVKVLASMLEKRLPFEKRPWVESLVFLSAPGLQIDLPANTLGGVVSRAQFAKAITFGEIPMVGDRLKRHTVNKPMVEATLQAMGKIGLLPSKAELRLGEFQLQTIIEDGPCFQDWLAEHDQSRSMKRRVRLYILPLGLAAQAGQRRADRRRRVRRAPQARPRRPWLPRARREPGPRRGRRRQARPPPRCQGGVDRARDRRASLGHHGGEEGRPRRAHRDRPRGQCQPALARARGPDADGRRRPGRRDPGRGEAVLVHPGLLARFQLAGFLDKLIEAAAGEVAPALFLVNPAQDLPTLQPIHGVDQVLDVPVGSNQHVKIPREWLGPAGGAA